MSRYIPKKIDVQVKERHFFECAWCGIKITERHHIFEFSKGGGHTTENLILLCPNCHDQVHNNEISAYDLIKRKSTHLEGDRIAHGIQFDIQEPIVRLGNATFDNVPILIRFREENIIEFKKLNDSFILNCRFYDQTGELIFWMSSNRYWCPSDFVVTSRKNQITITNEKNEFNNLKFWIEDGQINLVGNIFLNGISMEFSPSFFRYGNRIIKNISMRYCNIGINI
ncbi:MULTISPECIES: HNH endonuclease [Chryseobacterium]|uniref:HNH endonuclease n=1 Tax=Chryseobacterium TaxID=59732 RepID=UPI001628EC86|nr:MULTISPECIES: HNH endonuclease signature motif containing protein [Chryseobacterium]MDM1555795.1 HNH endonuclease [Chryseobacterium indologenes]